MPAHRLLVDGNTAAAPHQQPRQLGVEDDKAQRERAPVPAPGCYKKTRWEGRGARGCRSCEVPGVEQPPRPGENDLLSFGRSKAPASSNAPQRPIEPHQTTRFSRNASAIPRFNNAGVRHAQHKHAQPAAAQKPKALSRCQRFGAKVFADATGHVTHGRRMALKAQRRSN
jgi:hypothetical protein